MGRSLGGEWCGVGTQEENTAELKVSSPAQCVPQEGQVIDVLGRSLGILSLMTRTQPTVCLSASHDLRKAFIIYFNG